jgi:hypothetical protein
VGIRAKTRQRALTLKQLTNYADRGAAGSLEKFAHWGLLSGTLIIGSVARTIRGLPLVGVSVAKAAEGIRSYPSLAATEIGEQTSKLWGSTAVDDLSDIFNSFQIEWCHHRK